MPLEKHMMIKKIASKMIRDNRTYTAKCCAYLLEFLFDHASLYFCINVGTNAYSQIVNPKSNATPETSGAVSPRKISSVIVICKRMRSVQWCLGQLSDGRAVGNGQREGSGQGVCYLQQ